MITITFKLFNNKCLNAIRLFSTVTYENVNLERLKGKDKGIFCLAINRPTVKNAVNRNTIKELSHVLDYINSADDVRVLIFRSLAPGVFCSGADLKERSTLSEKQTSETSTSFRALTSQLESIQIPVVAAIDGLALGGGFEIALACDIRIAATNAKLGLVETKWAILPGAGGTQRLPRIAGPSIAKELIFTARVITSKDAERYGIVNHVVEQNESSTAAFEKALQIAREIIPNGPVGVKMAKMAINKGLEVDISSGCAVEGFCYAQIIPTKDRLEGLNAFLNKRQPQYNGE